MTFSELREKFEYISYDKFIFSETEDSYDVDYYYSLGEFRFIHKVNILKRDFFKRENLEDKGVFLFNLGICELISYYKAACPRKVILKAGALREEQLEFWKKLFYNGLGEFRFVNNIDISYDDWSNEWTFDKIIEMFNKKEYEEDFTTIENIVILNNIMTNSQGYMLDTMKKMAGILYKSNIMTKLADTKKC